MTLIRFIFLLFALGAACAAQAQITHRATTTSADASFIANGALITVNADVACPNAISPARPAGAIGDLLLLLVVSRQTTLATTTQTAGTWTLLYTATNPVGAEFEVKMYYKIAAGAAAATAADAITVTQTGTGGCDGISGRVSRFRNVDTVNPFLNVPVPAANVLAATDAVVGTGTETTVAENSMLLVASFIADNNAITEGAGWTNTYESAVNITNASDRDLALNLHRQLAQTAGAKSVPAAPGWAIGAVDPNVGVMFSLRPAVRITVPAGTLANDVMIAHITWTPNGTITAPAGWTLVRETNNTIATTSRLATYRKLASAADAAGAGGTANYEWTFLPAQLVGAMTGTISSYGNVDILTTDSGGTGVTGPINADNGAATASAFTHDAPTITTTVPNALLIRAYEFVTSPTSWSEPVQVPVANQRSSRATQTPLPSIAGISLASYDQFQAADTSGATGTRTATAVGGDAGRGAAHHFALRPLYAHYAVTYPGGASYATCEPGLVRISSHHAGHGLAAPPAGTVMTLGTSATGVWQSPIVTGTPANWVPSGLDNGVATYTWNGVEAYIEIRLRKNTAISLTITATDPNSRSVDAGENPTLTFANTILRVTADGSSSTSINSGALSHIAGKLNTEGTNIQTLYVQAVETAPGTMKCTTRFQGQNRDIDFAAVCNSPATCSGAAGTAFEIIDRLSAPIAVAKNPNTVTQATATYSAVSLAFSNDANAMAPLSFRYGDAGQMTLFLRHTLAAPPATTIGGTSNAFVVRPFGLFIDAGQGTSAKDQNSAVLAAAGDNFTQSVTAYKWASGEDDGTGKPAAGANITDNGTTPNFAATATVAPVTNLPGTALGSVSRGATCASASTIALAGGTASASDWCYSEVGNVLLRADVTNYISAGVDITGGSGLNDTDSTNGHVGRFRPKNFTVSGGAVTHRSTAGCAPASSFTYMDEPMSLAFTLTARNTQGAATLNYNGAYAKLNPATFASLNLGALDGAISRTARIDSGSTSAGSWSTSGTAAVTVTTMIRRATPDNPDGPFTALAFGIAPVDSDSVAMSAYNMDIDPPAGNEHTTLGLSVPVRYGRLRVQNAIGSEKLALPLSFATQHWSGTGFITNINDSCTTLSDANVAMSFTPASNLSDTACETRLGAATIEFASGVGRFPGPLPLTLTVPGAGNNGSVLLTPQLVASAGAPTYCPSAGGGPLATTPAIRSYLLGRWNDASNPDSNANTMYDDNPSGRAAFGVYGSQPSNYIYFRENH